MNIKQVLFYGLLESTNDLRSVFVVYMHFEKLIKFRKFIEIFHCCMTWLRNKKQDFFYWYLIIRTTLREQNTGQLNLKLDSHLRNIFFFWFASMKKWWKSISLYLESSLHSQNVWIFVLTSWSFRKNDLIRKLKSILEFMTSQPG